MLQDSPRWSKHARPFALTLTATMLTFVAPTDAATQQRGAAPAASALPTVETKTEGMTRIDGFMPLYWDDSMGQLWMEIGRWDTEILHLQGIAAGLGSNDIGLDRGRLEGSRIVEFERVGRKVLMIQPNYDFRSSSANPAEVRAVTDAFARSIVWGFTAAAQTGDRVLVELTDFLLTDQSNLTQRLRPGNYRLDAGRSTIYMPMTQGFPLNTEMEAELTFARQAGAAGGGGFGGGAFEGVGSVAATGEAASIRVHHSFVQLPDDNYTPRAYDPRSGYGSLTYEDYSAALGQPMTQRFIRRHRLEKRNPQASRSDPVEPIVYYLDPGTPEPIRSALLEGARWWNQAFDAAGYNNAFQVELLPEGASSLDIRYNVINWVHRSTRGWSYGASVTDPRTGEIIKGVVTLGSLRIRQDYLIAEGLLSPYVAGDETPTGLAEWALARIRQLSAHEVGHTIGLGHNYYDSQAGRISVLDYPHPYVTLGANQQLDYSDVYESGIGEWDSVAIAYGYQDFPAGTNEAAALQSILDNAWERDIRYFTNQDLEAHPMVDQWSNGTNAAAELNRMMEVRRVALSRFGEQAIKRGMPMATLEEALVPLYMHHRYQVDATVTTLGGVHYVYAIRGDGREPYRFATAAEQRAAMTALLGTIRPSALALPDRILDAIPPRPSGYGRHRELFPRYTGSMFDAITPAVVAASHTVSGIFSAQRAARMIEQHALDPALPGFDWVIDEVLGGSFGAAANTSYEQEIKRAVERVVIDEMLDLAASAAMPQVRAIVTHRLRQQATNLTAMASGANAENAAHYLLMADDIKRYLERPGAAIDQPNTPAAPPGAPIGG